MVVVDPPVLNRTEWSPLHIAAVHACRVRPYRSPQKLSCNSSTKCWNRSLIGITLAMGCRSPFGSALACEAKANLQPLAFYTINVTSPSLQFAWLGNRFVNE